MPLFVRWHDGRRAETHYQSHRENQLRPGFRGTTGNCKSRPGRRKTGCSRYFPYWVVSKVLLSAFNMQGGIPSEGLTFRSGAICSRNIRNARKGPAKLMEQLYAGRQLHRQKLVHAEEFYRRPAPQRRLWQKPPRRKSGVPMKRR